MWLWDEWPGRWGADCGIDLVFQHKNGDNWAVQSKCYAPDYHITKHDVDKFLSESNRPSIQHRLLIATTDFIGGNARQVCDAQEKPVVRFLLSDFDKSALDNLLVIDTGSVIKQVRGIIGQIAQTVSVIFLFTLLSGFAVLYAALLATRDERVGEAAILRTLGAQSGYLCRLHLAEFAVLGLLSGLFAAAGAALLGWILARFVLEIPYHVGLAIWPIGGLGGMLVVMLAGWLGTRRLIALPPLAILRE